MDNGKRKQFREIMEELVEAAKEEKQKNDFNEEQAFTFFKVKLSQ